MGLTDSKGGKALALYATMVMKNLIQIPAKICGVLSTIRALLSQRQELASRVAPNQNKNKFP